MTSEVVSRITVLDLPLERQLELTELLGYSTHAEWVEDMKESLKKCAEASARFQWGVRPEGWTEEDVERFQKKIDSTHGG